ncbi:TPA: HEPN domain-containing protein [bacterium]|nr:HEPN domain-containing protein [bacterium]
MSDMDEIKEWLKVAEDDLISAKILLGNDPPILVTACFHCQQAVEKSLKALLTWKDQRLESS